MLLSLLLPCTFTSDSGFRNLKDTRELEKRKSGAVGRDICWNGTKSTKSRPRNLRRRPTFAQILSSTTFNNAHKRCHCQQRLQQRLELRSPCRIPDLVSESVVVVICKRPMGHLHQWSLSLLLSWSLPHAFTSDSNFAKKVAQEICAGDPLLRRYSRRQRSTTLTSVVIVNNDCNNAWNFGALVAYRI